MTKKGKPKKDGRGQGQRLAKGRGGCKVLELFGKGQRLNKREGMWK